MSNKVESFKKRYLSLINCEEQAHVCPSLDGLSQIMENHIHRICFNGYAFFIMDVNAAKFDPYDFLDELIAHDQGGICFELNIALNELLKNLSYKTYLIDALVDNIKDNAVPSYDFSTHNAIVVELEDENYLVDVGLGNYFRNPVSFSEEYQDASGKYRIMPIDELDKVFRLERFSDQYNQWLSQYRFSLLDTEPSVFQYSFSEKVCDKDSYFHLNKEFFIVKPHSRDSYKFVDGSIENDLMWIHKSSDKEEKIKLDSCSARQILAEEFHMNTEQIERILSKCGITNDV